MAFIDNNKPSRDDGESPDISTVQGLLKEIALKKTPTLESVTQTVGRVIIAKLTKTKYDKNPINLFKILLIEKLLCWFFNMTIDKKSVSIENILNKATAQDKNTHNISEYFKTIGFKVTTWDFTKIMFIMIRKKSEVLIITWHVHPDRKTQYFNIKNTVFWVKEFEKYCEHTKLPQNKKFYVYSTYDDSIISNETTETFDYVGMNTVVLPKKDKEQLLSRLDNYLNNKQWYLDNKQPYKLIIVLHGEPGTGKTSLIRTIASYLGKDVVKFDLNSTKVGCIKYVPSEYITCIEDCDAYEFMKPRKGDVNYKELGNNNTITISSNDLNGKEKEGNSLSSLLQELDGICLAQDRVVILTTNYINNLDSAIIRPSRTDILMELKPLSPESIREFHGLKYPNSDQLDVSKLNVSITGSQLTSFYVEAMNDESEFRRLLFNYCKDKKDNK